MDSLSLEKPQRGLLYHGGDVAYVSSVWAPILRGRKLPPHRAQEPNMGAMHGMKARRKPTDAPDEALPGHGQA